MNFSWSRRGRAIVVIGVCVGALGAGALGGCGGDDNQAIGGGFPGTGGQDATVPEGGGDDAPASVVLCSEYGGYAFVQTLTSDLMKSLAADCRIGSYFGPLNPQTAHISDCLTQQIGTFFECPGVTYGSDSQGQKCRSMSDSHQGLNLRTADFNVFVEDFVAVMQAHKVSSSDIQEVVPTILGLQSQIVTSQQKGDTDCTCPNYEYDGSSCVEPDSGDDSGTDGGDSGTTDDGGTDAGTDTGSTVDANPGIDAASSEDAAGE